MVEKSIDLKEKFNESLAQESILHKSITDQQQIQIKLAQEDRDKAILDKSALEKSMTDIVARNAELEEINVSQRITINMQKVRESLGEKIEVLQAKNEDLTEKLHSLEMQKLTVNTRAPKKKGAEVQGK